jgi:hypothetical protein
MENETAKDTKQPAPRNVTIRRLLSVLGRLRIFIAYALAIASLLLYLFVIISYASKWDILTATTTFPIWLWAFAGGSMAFVAWSFVNDRRPLLILLLWCITTFFVADETKSILRVGDRLEKEHPGSIDGQKVLRVITLNCSKRNTDALDEVKDFNPDVVLFQEAPANRYAQELAKSLFGDEGKAVSNYFCGVVARGDLKHKGGSGKPPYQQVILTLPDGTEIDVFSIHLAHAVTRWDLWRPDAWRSYRNNRVERRDQLNLILTQYWKTGSTRPALLGGDFNAPPADGLFDSLRPEFEDSFRKTGRGLGNTFHNRLPAIRIDQIWARNGLTPVNARVVPTENSDHRMLVCDFLVPKNATPVLTEN